MKMMNNYLICEVKEKKKGTQTGFEVNNLDQFQILRVLYSSEEDIPVDSKVKVSINAGVTDDLGLIIKRNEVIYVL